MESSVPESFTYPHKKIGNKKLLIAGGIILLLFLLLGAYMLGAKVGSTTVANSSQSLSVPQPTFTRVLHKGFTFSVKDSSGNVAATFTYLIESLQLQNEIIIKGQKADAIGGRTFLILNLKITNPSTQTIQLNTRDFVRVSIDDQKELLAPNIHNDPIAIQPISTEYTRLALPIDNTVKKVVLHVGELNGTKTDIPVTLSK